MYSSRSTRSLAGLYSQLNPLNLREPYRDERSRKEEQGDHGYDPHRDRLLLGLDRDIFHLSSGLSSFYSKRSVAFHRFVIQYPLHLP